MPYHSVNNRCYVDFSEFDLPIPLSQSLEIIKKEGFSNVNVDLVDLARRQIQVSQYRRGAMLSEAPEVFDCSSLIKWLYAQKGIWLPRRSIQQREFGINVNIDETVAGDIVFVSGNVNYYINNPDDGVGHVGIITENKTVIHAANRSLGIIESSLDSFIDGDRIRGIRRILPISRLTFTFITPMEREIEWSDDIRWIILQNLPE